ncbi:MAG TPA: acyl-CoA reductase [Flavobacteriaceae bacterium]|nr:acyl-CoA reductase [Flavobacteriaceae bacterium]
MDLKQRIQAFSALGKFLNQIVETYEKQSETSLEMQKAVETIDRAEAANGWFTRENILFSFKNWATTLTRENLETWTSHYLLDSIKSKTIAVIMAGNIPLVGFHDFLAVLISGHRIKVKLSSNDRILLPFLAEFLVRQNQEFSDRIDFVQDKLDDFDAVIATGSNNTARYFDYYFGKYPHIIRRNRNSVAILTGEETPEDLERLADDIFLYFGLGCRNVSKIYVPIDYDFELFFRACYRWKDIIYNNKYINNYDYNKAVYLMEGLPLLDNEFLILKEDPGFSSPIGVLFYQTYSDKASLLDELRAQESNIQCVIGQVFSPENIPFGKAQTPHLMQYADGIDTLEFLQAL